MRSRVPSSRERRYVGGWLLALLLFAFGCGGNDYYFLNEIRGEGDTALLEFLYTCGTIDVTWDGAFVGQPHFHGELVVKHDANGADCDEFPREVAFDLGPMKRSFRAQHPWPTPVGIRVAPFEEEQGAICLPNLFQVEPFKGRRCK